MPRRKISSHDLREAIVVAHQSGKGYKAFSKQFEIHHSTARRIGTNGELFRQLPSFPVVGVPANSVQGQIVFCSGKKKERTPGATPVLYVHKVLWMHNESLFLWWCSQEKTEQLWLLWKKGIWSMSWIRRYYIWTKHIREQYPLSWWH